MKVNLSEHNFDLDSFLSSVNLFEMTHGNYPNYVVMNEQTCDAIESRYRTFYVENEVYFKHSKRYNSKIFGTPIAYCNALPFGIVDII